MALSSTEFCNRTRVLIAAVALILIATLAACADDAGPLVFRRDGHAVRTLSFAQMCALAPPITVTIKHPSTGQLTSYRALPLAPLLRAVYASRVGDDKNLIFVALDGYQSVIPVTWARRHTGYLAFASASGQAFEQEEHGKVAPLGPYYLIWEDVKDAHVLEAGGHFWPYQVNSIDITTFAERYPAMTPPPSRDPRVQSGFKAFRANCMACHSINGQGGTVGPELNYPTNVTEYYNERFLHAWIRNPQRIRMRTPMPPFPAMAHPDRVIDDIIAYLRAMRHKKSWAPTKKK